MDELAPMSCPNHGVRANEAPMHLLFNDQDMLCPSVVMPEPRAPNYGTWKIVQLNWVNDGLGQLGSNPLLNESGLNCIIRPATTTFFLVISDLLTISFRLFFYFFGDSLWQDAENRVYIIKELDRITGQGQSAVSVDDTLKIIACREQQKKLSALEMELAAARPEGFKLNHMAVTNQPPMKRPLVVIGVLTGFSRKTNRDAIRKAWMGTGSALKKMEDRKGIIVRFVIGRSSNRGDSLERAIDSENKQTNDFIILENHTEALEEIPKKTKNFFAQASEKWDAEFFAKVNDDVYVNIDALGSTLAAHLDKPRAYIGCMKSGEVFSEQSHKWYEPDWWKFGNKKSIVFTFPYINDWLLICNRYFRHASGEMFVISQALAKFVSINRSILRTYAHDDVSVGSWFIGLDVKHVDERTFCCSSSSWSSGLSLSLSLLKELSAQVYDHTKNHEKNNSNNKFQKYLKDML
ncbi:hypothetical protein RHMOL_Rhmol03G0223100 [Rhododendron molle]|uniref:Uncharacterized protein n=1 Tax=Rhododendron molle TaxID=49168 RepID=A0ACC0PKB8_RHOML|nr:hypothetical protein RHMOL_Rhmol03G0223100 [Rhododendron molle]